MATCRRTGFMDRSKLAGEQRFLDNVYNELIHLYGIEISYYQHGYALSAHDFLYGEDVTAPFAEPITMNMLGQVNDDALLLSKFGIMTNADAVFIVGVKSFAEAMSADYAEPKVGSLIRLDFMDGRPGAGGFPNKDDALSAFEFCKDPEAYMNAYSQWLSSRDVQDWIRSAPIYEITVKRDYLPNKNINIMGTYPVWYIECIKWDYSYEPNAPREKGSEQVSDSTLYGKLTGGTTVAEPSAKYPQNVEDKVRDDIWNYNGDGQGRDSVYGDY